MMDCQARCRWTAFSAVMVTMAVLSAGPASACFTRPQAPDPAKLVRGTNMIVLARVIDIRTGSFYAEYRFKVLEVLKGRGSIGRFVRTEIIRRSRPGSVDNDFNAHRDRRFWEGKADRASGMKPDCMFDQTFTKGQTYLIFRVKRTRRAAEVIKSKNDRWLATVRRLTEGK